MKSLSYIVFHKGKDTGIFVKTKSVKFSELKKRVPDAHPMDSVTFQPIEVEITGKD